MTWVIYVKFSYRIIVKNPYWAFFTITIHGIALWYLVLNACYFIQLNTFPPIYLIVFPLVLLLIVSYNLFRVIRKNYLHPWRIYRLLGAGKREVIMQVVIQAMLLSLISGLFSSISFDIFYPLAKGFIEGSDLFNWNSIYLKLVYLIFTFLSGLLISILPATIFGTVSYLKPINPLKLKLGDSV